MNNIRVIARLDIKGPDLVKGVHLEGLRVLGKPEDFARYYYEAGIDELFYMDVVASLYGRNSLLDIVERTALQTNIPFTVGGGIRTIEDIKTVLRAGADKVSINTAAIKNPDFIRQAASHFGSSTVVVSIEVIKQSDGQYMVFTDNGREPTGKEVLSWAREVAQLGAGEIMLTSVDQEGTGLGFDIELIRRIAQSVPIAVIACGGAGKVEHVKQVIVDGAADAVSIASMLHYEFIKNNRAQSNATQGNTEFLKRGGQNSRIEPSGVGQIKSYLWSQGIACRHRQEELAA